MDVYKCREKEREGGRKRVGRLSKQMRERERERQRTNATEQRRRGERGKED